MFLWRAGSSPAGWRGQEGFLSRYTGEPFWPVGAARKQRKTTRLSAGRRRLQTPRERTPLSRGRFGSSDADIFHRYNNSSFIFHFQDSGLSFPAPCLNSGCKSRRRPQKGQIHRPLLARRGGGTSPAPSTILVVVAITDIPSFSKPSRPAGTKVGIFPSAMTSSHTFRFRLRWVMPSGGIMAAERVVVLIVCSLSRFQTFLEHGGHTEAPEPSGYWNLLHLWLKIH